VDRFSTRRTVTHACRLCAVAADRIFHTNCGKRCEQARHLQINSLICIKVHGKAQFLGSLDLYTARGPQTVAQRAILATCGIVPSSGASPCAQFTPPYAQRHGHSSQILWKRLWAMPLIRIKVLEFKGIFCCADFLGNRIQTPSNALARGRVLVYSHKLWKTMWAKNPTTL